MENILKQLLDHTVKSTARFLQQRREIANLGLSDVAQKTGISIEALTEYETGDVAIPSDDLFLISRSIGIPDRILASKLYDIYLEVSTIRDCLESKKSGTTDSSN